MNKDINLQIIEKLTECINEHPDMTFGQILYNYTPFKGNHDPFYDDPLKNLEYMKTVLKGVCYE